MCVMLWRLIYRLLYYIWYSVCRLRYWHGRDVHSPQVFDLVENVFQVPYTYYIYKRIENRRGQLIRSQERIHVKDFGTGRDRMAKVSRLVLESSESSEAAQLLHKLCVYRNPNTILELGTQVGLTTSYLASAAPKAVVHTIEGAPEVAAVAKKTFDLIPVSNVKQHVGNIDDQLPNLLSRVGQLDFVFMDANHTYDATMRYFGWIKKHLTERSIVVIDDIHWSPEMGRAWDEIRKEKPVTSSIDCYDFGILLFESHLERKTYVF